MFNTFDHLNNHQREVWSLINKFDSFDIKSIPYTKNCDTIMLIEKASNLYLYYDFIDMEFDAKTCRPWIPSTNWRNSNDDRYTSKGSIINEKQHEVVL